MIGLVVDTSILIDYFRGGAKGQQFVNKVERGKIEEIFLPTIVIFELFSGQSSKSPVAVHKILNLLKFFQRIELNEEIARRAGELYRDVNKTLQVPDYIIAASALSVNGEIVTLNRRHFEQIPNLSLYPLS